MVLIERGWIIQQLERSAWKKVKWFFVWPAVNETFALHLTLQQVCFNFFNSLCCNFPAEMNPKIECCATCPAIKVRRLKSNLHSTLKTSVCGLRLNGGINVSVKDGKKRYWRQRNVWGKKKMGLADQDFDCNAWKRRYPEADVQILRWMNESHIWR